MRRLLLLVLAAALCAACAPEAPMLGARVTNNWGDGSLVIERTGSFDNAGSGAARVTGALDEGKPLIQRGATTAPGVGCPSGTIPIVTQVRDGNPVVECRYTHRGGARTGAPAPPA